MIEKFSSIERSWSEVSLFGWEQMQMMYKAACNWFAFQHQYPPPVFLLKTQGTNSCQLPIPLWEGKPGSQFLKAQCGSSHSRLPIPGRQCEGNRRDTLTSHQAHSRTQSLLTENTRKSERASCAFCCFRCFVLSQYNYWSCLGEEEQRRCWLLHGWKLLLSPGTAACVLCSELAHIKISG